MPRNHATRAALSLLVGGLVWATLSYWYSWSAQPLEPWEIETYVDAIRAQTQQPGGRIDLDDFQRFLAEDDGRPFYTVNLYRYAEWASYEGDAAVRVTGRDAYEKFGQVMVRLLARRGSHPVFGSSRVLESRAGWDRIVVVRYRSRRDMAEIFASDEFAEASAHKWASIARHDRLVVQALHLPGGGIVMAMVGALISAVAWVAVGRATRVSADPTVSPRE